MSTPLLIRPLRLEDARSLLAFELANRAYFERWITPRAAAFYSLDGVKSAIASAEAAREADHGYQFLVLEGERIVGRVNLHEVRRAHFNMAELGYRVGEHEVGRGIASQAVALCLAQAFGDLGLWRVEAIARPENVASMRVLERNGFVAFGRSRRSFQLGGQWFDRVHFERHRDGVPAASARLPAETGRD